MGHFLLRVMDKCFKKIPAVPFYKIMTEIHLHWLLEIT